MEKDPLICPPMLNAPKAPIVRFKNGRKIKTNGRTMYLIPSAILTNGAIPSGAPTGVNLEKNSSQSLTNRLLVSAKKYGNSIIIKVFEK